MKVKYLVMDINASYAQLIKMVFPKAQIITDRFHIVQHINRSFNQLRVKIMHSFRKSNSADQKKYRRLKRFWKLLLKDINKLNITNRPYIHLFKRPFTQKDIVDELLSYDETLNLAYQTIQAMRYYFKHKMKDAFFKKIHGLDKQLPQWFREKFHVFIKYKKGIENALLLPFSNGQTEGLNNKIKVIKRISFGYRNFYHLRDRIYLIQGLVFS